MSGFEQKKEHISAPFEKTALILVTRSAVRSPHVHPVRARSVHDLPQDSQIPVRKRPLCLLHFI